MNPGVSLPCDKAASRYVCGVSRNGSSVSVCSIIGMSSTELSSSWYSSLLVLKSSMALTIGVSSFIDICTFSSFFYLYWSRHMFDSSSKSELIGFVFFFLLVSEGMLMRVRGSFWRRRYVVRRTCLWLRRRLNGVGLAAHFTNCRGLHLVVKKGFIVNLLFLSGMQVHPDRLGSFFFWPCSHRLFAAFECD